MSEIFFNYTLAAPYLQQHEFKQMEPMVLHAHRALHERTGPGANFLGWLDVTNLNTSAQLAEIKQTAIAISDRCDVLIIIGVGGSYLGAKALIDMLSHTFYNQFPSHRRTTPEVYYIGNHLSAPHMQHLLEYIADKEICINVISKSGATTEVAVAFHFLRSYLIDRLGATEAKKRIFVTTDPKLGNLRRLAMDEGYKTFTIPPNVGGRYSVLTPVGLLPLATVGVDIDEVVSGAQDLSLELSTFTYLTNACYLYATARNLLARKGKLIELLAFYEPCLNGFAEWWKQLFGESEGKDNKGIFPVSLSYTTDLHSLGQYVQDGMRHLFETVLEVDRCSSDIIIPKDELDRDDLSFLTGRKLHEVNKQVARAVSLAHSEGGVHNLVIRIKSINPYTAGQLVYFFQKACAISGYILGVNPFDQPGVEAYKRKMFRMFRSGEGKDA